MNRDQALQWLVDSVTNWPMSKQVFPVIDSPDGWEWVVGSGQWKHLLSCGDVIGRDEWIAAKQPAPLTRDQALAWLVENVKGWPFGDNEAGWSVESCNGWEWRPAKGSWAFTSEAWVFIDIQEWQAALLVKQ